MLKERGETYEGECCGDGQEYNRHAAEDEHRQPDCLAIRRRSLVLRERLNRSFLSRVLTFMLGRLHIP